MREIKFRVWDKIGKRMYYNGGLEIKGNTILSTMNFPMQYTGLKDKNGKEIYEGDILQAKDDDDSTALVEYISTGFEIKRVHPDYDNYEDFAEYLKWSNAEVVGNKFENPEKIGGR